MNRRLLKKAQVVSGKTAGIMARETLAMAKKAGGMPGVIKAKTAEVIQVTGKALKINRLKSELRNWERKRLVTFTNFGKGIFKLVGWEEKKIWQRKEIKRFLHELRECEAEIRWIKTQITEIEENSKEQIGYHEAILNLNSKEKDIRLAAVKFLQQRGGKDVIPILAKRLEDPDLKVRQETVRALHKIINEGYPQRKPSRLESGQEKVKETGQSEDSYSMR